MTTEIKKTEAKVEKKMSLAEFTQKAIVAMRDKEKSLGINTVYSGYNQALEKYFGKDVIAKLKCDVEWGGQVHPLVGALAVPHILAKEGKIALRPIRGGKGVQIFLPSDLKTARQDSSKADELLAKLGIKV